jgi:hypothetical protein
MQALENFYGPAAEIMYILVLILVGARIVRDFRPLSPKECLASAASTAADGDARGLATRRRVSSRAAGTGSYRARRYRRLITRWASEVMGPASRLHHVPCLENAVTSAYTASLAGS